MLTCLHHLPLDNSTACYQLWWSPQLFLLSDFRVSNQAFIRILHDTGLLGASTNTDILNNLQLVMWEKAARVLIQFEIVFISFCFKMPKIMNVKPPTLSTKICAKINPWRQTVKSSNVLYMTCAKKYPLNNTSCHVPFKHIAQQTGDIQTNFH